MANHQQEKKNAGRLIFKGRSETMAEIVKTVCYMCTRACGMDVYVERGRMIKVEGMREHLVSKGGLCPRGLAAVQYEYDPKRLLHPLKRTGKRGGGKWQQISWDEAIAITAKELRRIKEEYGAKSVIFYKGSGNGWDTCARHVHRFMNVFGSPNCAFHSELCYVPVTMALGCTMGGMPRPDFENSRCVVLWGSNPFTSAVANSGRRVLDAKQRGAKVIVIDARFSSAAAKADLFIRPRPGTDGALALGMLNVMIEEGLYDRDFVSNWTYGFDKLKELVRQYTPEKLEAVTWVPQAMIREGTRLYAGSGRACIAIGNGVDMHTNCVQTSRAIAALMAISGNLDQPGGNVFAVLPKLADVTLPQMFRSDVKSIDRHPLYFRPEKRLAGRDMVDALLTGEPYPPKGMIVMDGDPVASLGNTGQVTEALKMLDFLVVHELFMTSVAELADIVLPASSPFESSQFCTYSAAAGPPVNMPVIALRNKVVDAPGECHSDFEFVSQLARELGYGEYFQWETAEEAFEEELRPTGFTVKDLKEHPEGLAKKVDAKDVYHKYKTEGFKTPTKKVELYSTTFEQFGYDPLPTFEEPGESPVSRPDLAKEYPLIGNTGIKPVLYTDNQFRTVPWLKEIMPDSWLEIHPQKAKELRIGDGDMVWVESPRGGIKIRARFAEDIHPGTVFIPHGWGQPYAHGPADNLLTPGLPLCPHCGATGNRSFLCRVRKA